MGIPAAKKRPRFQKPHEARPRARAAWGLVNGEAAKAMDRGGAATLGQWKPGPPSLGPGEGPPGAAKQGALWPQGKCSGVGVSLGLSGVSGATTVGAGGCPADAEGRSPTARWGDQQHHSRRSASAHVSCQDPLCHSQGKLSSLGLHFLQARVGRGETAASLEKSGHVI